MLYADSGFLSCFDFKILNGNPEDLLRLPYTMVLTRETARRYFGDQDPVGQVLSLNNQQDFTVTGIIESPPANSHFRFDMLCSFVTLYENPAGSMDVWTGNINYYLYVRGTPETSAEDINRYMDELLQIHAGKSLDEMGIGLIPRTIPITRIHLHSHTLGELETNSNIQYVRIFSAIILFLLLIASINYMNLSTARSVHRAREVGIKKVAGVSRGTLMWQFLGESVLLCLITFLLSLILIELLLPAFNILMGKELEFSISGNTDVFLMFLALVILLGLVSGSYPALFLSSFKASSVLKGMPGTGISSRLFRNILVIIQFSLAVILIISSLVVLRQVDYIRNKNLGFSKEHLLVVPLRSSELRKDYRTLKEELGKLPYVLDVSASQNYPGATFSGNGYRFPDEGSDEEKLFASIDVDEDFMTTYRMEIIQGRNFSSDHATDDMALLINEETCRILGWDDPLGKDVVFNGTPGYKIIGVVKDFYFTSLHQEILPVIISYRDHRFQYLTLRIVPENIQQTVRSLQQVWTGIDPDRPFDFFFLDETFENLYKNETRMKGIFGFFTLLAILIALLGLYGLSAFLTEQKTKEIGIRKVMGASVAGVTSLLSWNFLRIVLLANVLGLPAGYLVMNRWLQDYAYHTNMPAWIFILAVIISVAIALLTVFYHALRSSLANPADSLRYE